jgi:hypothetical protein
MANNMSAYLASGIMMNFFKGSPAFVFPSTLAFALTSTPPTNTTYVEVPNVGGYARQVLNSGTGNWSFPYPNSGIVYNNPQVTFPIATASWGFVSGCVLVDNATYGSGNMLFYTTLGTPKDIGVNDQFYAPASGITCRIS